jgi:GT2 family glycosyltransferase
VVDQSRGDQIAAVVADFARHGARTVPSWRRGTGLAFNVGLAAVTYDAVLVTDDDCTVAEDWVARGYAYMSAVPDGMVSGRVLPAGDPDAIPSLQQSPERRDYTGDVRYGLLFTNNCCFSRSGVVGIGGFDELIRPVAEDNDLCYRWLRAGKSLRYEPDLVVWHHEWRSHDELVRWYVEYAKSQGMFYAKYLCRGEREVAGYIASDVRLGCRGIAARLLYGRPPWSDWRQGILRGLPVGLARGLLVFGRERIRGRLQP